MAGIVAVWAPSCMHCRTWVGWRIDAASTFVGHLRLAALAPSLGGPDTLVNHPASMTHAALTPEQRAAVGIGDGMIRLSVGLEDTEDLLADIGQALAAVD